MRPETLTDQIDRIIQDLAEEKETFTPDDVRPRLPAGANARQIAAPMARARRDGRIIEVARVKSQVPESKGRLIAVYRAAHKAPLPLPPSVGGTTLNAPSSADIKDELDVLRDFLEYRGYLIGQEELAALLLMLATRPWLVLAGPTGTGKSSIVRLLSEAFEGELYDLQVRPNWTSSDDVLGYYSEIAKSFLPGPLYNALLIAAQDPATIRFVRFDEMNLASPEYYLAEALSAAEYWEGPDPAGLRRSSAINLPPMPESAQVADVRLWDSVFLVGTLNMDETAKALSPKVLDRAAVYDLHHVDLYSLPFGEEGSSSQSPKLPSLRQLLLTRPHTLRDVRDDLGDDDVQVVGDLLSRLDGSLRVLGAPVGYRQRDAFLVTIAVWRKNALGGVLAFDALLDVCLRSIVLPKLQGSSLGAVSALRDLIGALLDIEEVPSEASVGHLRDLAQDARFPRTLERTLDMLEQAQVLGYFSAW